MPVTTFIETPRFSTDISEGSTGGPMYKTYVFEGESGVEQRNVNWPYPRQKYSINKGIRDAVDMQEVIDFFYVCKGKAIGFRYKDWTDYNLTLENIGTGDGVETVFLY